jgi:hypothetical protein
MDRSVLGAIFGSLFGISALGGLAFIGASPNPMPGKPEGDWRLLDPVAYENITVFPVVSSSTQDTSPFLTLDEGLSSGAVIVSEQGAAGLARSRDGRPVAVPQYNTGASVNQLVLINRGKRPLLLLAGELVSGGKQDRIIGKDRIVPVGSDPLPLDVFCVEHGPACASRPLLGRTRMRCGLQCGLGLWLRRRHHELEPRVGCQRLHRRS